MSSVFHACICDVTRSAIFLTAQNIQIYCEAQCQPFQISAGKYFGLGGGLFRSGLRDRQPEVNAAACRFSVRHHIFKAQPKLVPCGKERIFTTHPSILATNRNCSTRCLLSNRAVTRVEQSPSHAAATPVLHALPISTALRAKVNGYTQRRGVSVDRLLWQNCAPVFMRRRNNQCALFAAVSSPDSRDDRICGSSIGGSTIDQAKKFAKVCESRCLNGILARYDHTSSGKRPPYPRHADLSVPGGRPSARDRIKNEDNLITIVSFPQDANLFCSIGHHAPPLISHQNNARSPGVYVSVAESPVTASGSPTVLPRKVPRSSATPETVSRCTL